MASDGCMVCTRDREGHRQAEKAGEVNHEFSEDGRVVPLSKPVQTGPPQAMAIDPVLRWLLVSKGLVTGSELLETESQLRSTGLLVTPSAGD